MFWRAAKALAVYAGISARSTSERSALRRRQVERRVLRARSADEHVRAGRAHASTAATSPFTTAAKSGGVSRGCDIAQPRSAPRGDGERQSGSVKSVASPNDDDSLLLNIVASASSL